jgi:hypothetical protein
MLFYEQYFYNSMNMVPDGVLGTVPCEHLQVLYRTPCLKYLSLIYIRIKKKLLHHTTYDVFSYFRNVIRGPKIAFFGPRAAKSNHLYYQCSLIHFNGVYTK